jgi:hypothetical protein
MPHKHDTSSGAGSPAPLAFVARRKLQDSTVSDCIRNESTRTRSYHVKVDPPGIGLRNVGFVDRMTMTETVDSGVDLNGRYTHVIRNVLITAFDRNNHVTGTAVTTDYGTLRKGDGLLPPCNALNPCATATTAIENSDGILTFLKNRNAKAVYGADAKGRGHELKRLEVEAKK